ncbi:hypothetical protein DP73_11280 [Desulfosporosinus sp. HMP52]|nr:hypothetical protein DP73_11280 [Desulfosporosinus sp. HMP52]
MLTRRFEIVLQVIERRDFLGADCRAFILKLPLYEIKNIIIKVLNLISRRLRTGDFMWGESWLDHVGLTPSARIRQLTS